LGELEALYDACRDRVEFFVVYIREAHPEDGWVLTSNREAGIAFADPRTEGERAAVAETCVVRMEIRLPVLLDGLDDEVARQYGGWPDRLYLVGREGFIAFQGGEGPFGFKPDELGAAIEAELSRV
jgi:iodothyronine deiodinase-like protein